ncbi:MAG TPA: SGNH/GDSL hydrolase family protein [Bacilli bacterium]|nr:SGNH/GDSL hydrolase family protein [Bacilli bacterium]
MAKKNAVKNIKSTKKKNSKKKNSIMNSWRGIIVIVCLILTIIGCGIWQAITIQSLKKTVKDQTNQINDISEKIGLDEISIAELNPSIDDEAKEYLKKCDDDHYNVMYIGNSITRHDYNNNWWSNDRGMAASTLEKDYVSLVTSAIGEKQKLPVNKYSYNYATWEVQSHDRAEMLPLIKSYLNFKLDLVVIQLGENVSNIDTFESDLEELIEYVKKYAPNAQVVAVGDFWVKEARENIKKKVTTKLNIPYADLSPIWNKKEYEAGLGTTIIGKDGTSHKIDHSGVAIHPGDKGMEYIANKVIELIKF